tara:strand:+ start:2550 stop:2780 length:231 start_codon:yes stop_codon:yes gene_type:complete
MIEYNVGDTVKYVALNGNTNECRVTSKCAVVGSSFDEGPQPGFNGEALDRDDYTLFWGWDENIIEAKKGEDNVVVT